MNSSTPSNGCHGLVLTADQRAAIIAYHEADEAAQRATTQGVAREANARARRIRDEHHGTIGTWIALGLWRGDWRAVLGVR